jgi:Holliday junction resolvase RusA-like endonuclease
MKARRSVGDKVRIVIDGKPPKKDRPRFRSIGKFAQTYSTKETVECEKRVSRAWKEQGGGVTFDGAVSVGIDIFYEVPASIAKNSKKRASAMIADKWKVTKPDIDNVIKSVLDGLNGLAFSDDNQVAVLKSRKMYGKKEKTVVTVESLNKEKE